MNITDIKIKDLLSDQIIICKPITEDTDDVD